MSELGNIIKKIKDLIELSQDRDDEEAQTAMLLARKLMIKHNLKKGDLVFNNKTKIVERNTNDWRVLKWWEVRLARIIEENFRVKRYCNRKRNNGQRRIVFFGLEDDVEIATEMYDLTKEIMLFHQRRFINDYYDGSQEKRNVRKTNRLKNAYLNGFLDSLEEKFHEQTWQLRKKYDLVLLCPTEVEDAYEDLMSDAVESRPIPQPNVDFEDLFAYEKGQQDGDKVDLTRSTVGEQTEEVV